MEIENKIQITIDKDYSSTPVWIQNCEGTYISVDPDLFFYHERSFNLLNAYSNMWEVLMSDNDIKDVQKAIDNLESFRVYVAKHVQNEHPEYEVK